jgi:GAF domain-containing protein/GGDEF domain-containing protein
MSSEGKITCCILGAAEKDLEILSDLQQAEGVRIAFIYDPDPDAVGLEIAEILGIPGYSSVDLPADGLDYIVVSEPRERFRDVLEHLAPCGAGILTPAEARKTLCGEIEEKARVVQEESYTIEDALRALEQLFDKKALLKFLLETAVRAVHASSGSIMLYSPDAYELYIGYAIGLSDRVVKNTRQKLGEGIAGTVAREKRAKLLKPRPGETLYTTDRERVDIVSAASIPLLWRNRLLGVLNVSTSRGEHELDENDLESLKKLSRRISKVLSESLKVQEIQIHHQEKDLRNAVGKLVEKPASFQEKIYLLAQYLAELLGIESVEIYLNTQAGDWFLLGGSNRRLIEGREKLKSERGVLSRCFLDQKPIILTERTEETEEGITADVASFVYYPLTLSRPLGVMLAEFSDREKLEEFLALKDSIGMEVASFVASESRARRMRYELDTMGRVSNCATALLTCRTMDELGDVFVHLLADVFKCERVSVRFKAEADEEHWRLFMRDPRHTFTKEWQAGDEELFSDLRKRGEPFARASLDFDPVMGAKRHFYSSLMAVPVIKGDEFLGGFIVYDKTPSDPLEETIFNEFDMNIAQQITSMAVPVYDAIRREEPLIAEKVESSYESILSDNMQRLMKVCEREIQRSERYHHSFTLILFQIDNLENLFREDYSRALELVEEITRGIRTRTRKTDYLSWVEKAKFALLSLEGGTRTRFLVSRILVYLSKDMASFLGSPLQKSVIKIGEASYPGRARNAEELLGEAQEALKPADRS